MKTLEWNDIDVTGLGKSIKELANPWGNVEMREHAPEGTCHIPGKRLLPLCRKLGIDAAPAMVGWTGSRKWRRPDIDGVVVSAHHEKKLKDEITAREVRSQKRKY